MNARSVLLAGMLAFSLASCSGATGTPPQSAMTVPQSSQSLYGRSVSSLTAQSTSATQDDTATQAGESAQEAATSSYCSKVGGSLEVRHPEFGTNNPNPLVLAGSKRFCKFTAKDGSRIYIFPNTLYAAKPTLAVLAYLAKVQLGSCQGNPASCYCTLLGGSDQFGGTNAAGGGWVLQGSVDPVLEACIFPDLSSIDSWGLAYHSAGIIRGIDLSTIVRYKPS